jgi:hypothetical protein
MMPICFRIVPIIFIITLLCIGITGCGLPMNQTKPEKAFKPALLHKDLKDNTLLI